MALRSGLCLLMIALSAHAQRTLGTIAGAVSDSDKAVVANAPIEAKNVATAMVYKTVSSSDGTYTLSPLPAGAYEISAAVPGFKEFREKVAVLPSQALRFDIHLDDDLGLNTLGEDRLGFGILLGRKPTPPSGSLPRMPDGKPDLSGIWSALTPVQPPEVLPLPWAEAVIKERQANLLKDFPGARCLPQSQILLPLLHSKFIHTPSLLVALIEYDNPSHREVFLDGREHPKNVDPTWTGHSIGKWDGDTLIVDTVGFNDKTWLIIPGQPPQGHPHTEKLHIIQRFHRLDLGRMEVEVTFEDPGAYQKPWTVKGVSILMPNEQIDEYICNENNQDVEHLVGK